MVDADAKIIGSYIDGERSSASDGTTVPLLRPQEDVISAQILEGGQAAVDAAVVAARRTFLSHRRASTIYQRAKWLTDGAAALEAASEEVAQIICEDVGKPIRPARFETSRGPEFMRACAAVVSHLSGEVLPLDAVQNGAGCLGMVRRIPYGVVATISPFNAPVNLLVQKLAPAIAAGNSVVAKPSPAGTRTALFLAELFERAGWPKGLFNVVTGDRVTANALVKHPDVRAVSFTGGTVAGDALARAAGAKKFLAELGSNAANIVLEDADIKTAASKIAGAGFEASGQQCISAQRVLVQKSILEDFLAAFKEAALKLKVGPATDPQTDIGPMIHGGAADRIMALIEDARKLGAREILAATRSGLTISPGILVDVPANARLWKEEAFGPVVAVVSFDTVDEALQLANDSEFGLQGAVFTQKLDTMLKFAQEFDVGSLWINEASRFRLDIYPFGGVKQSGVGREGVRYAIEEMSQLKFIGIRGNL